MTDLLRFGDHFVGLRVKHCVHALWSSLHIVIEKINVQLFVWDVFVIS
jgi:hypothetical protein